LKDLTANEVDVSNVRIFHVSCFDMPIFGVMFGGNINMHSASASPQFFLEAKKIANLNPKVEERNPPDGAASRRLVGGLYVNLYLVEVYVSRPTVNRRTTFFVSLSKQIAAGWMSRHDTHIFLDRDVNLHRHILFSFYSNLTFHHGVIQIGCCRPSLCWGHYCVSQLLCFSLVGAKFNFQITAFKSVHRWCQVTRNLNSVSRTLW
jgi:hypothetical protein